MQTFLRILLRCVALGLMVFSLPASAYLKFTYTSDELPLTAAFTDGYPSDTEYVEWYPLSFTVSFDVEEKDLSLKPVTDFFMEDFSFEFHSEHNLLYYPLRLSPASYGRVSLNREGEVVGWNLTIAITELLLPDTDIWSFLNVNHRVDISSRGGSGTINTDNFFVQFHPITWHGEYIQLVRLGFEYSGANDSGNWTIEKISVPEPTGAGLVLAGLAGLVCLRRIKRG